MVLAVLLFLSEVPWYPYRPYCSLFWEYTDDGERRPLPDWVEPYGVFGPYGLEIRGRVSEAFAKAVVEEMRFWGVGAVRFGPDVFTRFRDRIGAGGQFHNAHVRSVIHFPRPTDGSNPVWVSMPEDLKKRVLAIAETRELFEDCELARALTMENWGR